MYPKRVLFLRVLLPVLLQLPVERIITAAQVGVFSKITGQQAQRYLQGTKVFKVKQVVIDSVRIDSLLVELEMVHGEGIDARIVADEERTPGVNDLPERLMMIRAEQCRQRSTVIKRLVWRLLIPGRLFPLRSLCPLVTIEVLVIHTVDVHTALFIDIDHCAAMMVTVCLMQLLQQPVQLVQDFGRQHIAESAQIVGRYFIITKFYSVFLWAHFILLLN